MADGLVHCVEKGGWYPTCSYTIYLLLSRADVNDNVKLILRFPFANSRLFNVQFTQETMTESQFCVPVGCDGFRKSVSGRIDSSALSLFLLRCSFSLALSLFLLPSVFLSLLPALAFLPPFLPSFLPSVVISSSGDALRTNRHFQPLPCVFYVREISQEFAYMQITSHLFEISHRQICSRQPYRFRFSALQDRHVRARFECPGTLCPLPSHPHSQIWILAQFPQHHLCNLVIFCFVFIFYQFVTFRLCD